MKTNFRASTMQIFRIITISVLLILLIITFINTVVVSMDSQKHSNDRTELVINLNRFMDGSAYLTSEVRAYAALGDSSHYDNYWNEVNNLKNRDIAVSNMIEIGITDDEAAIITEMQSISNELIPLESAAMDSVDANDIDSAIASVFGDEYESGLLRISVLQTELSEMINNRTELLVAADYAMNNVLYIIMVVLLILIVLVLFISEHIISKRLIKPIDSCSKALHEISKGNLDYQLSLESDSTEIGVLVASTKETVSNISQIIHELSSGLSSMAQGNFTYNNITDTLFVGDYKPLIDSYNLMNTDLPNTLKQIQQSSNLVRGGSEQLADNSQSLAQGASEQGSAIQLLTESISEMSSRIKQTAEDARNVKLANNSTRESLSISNNQMQDMMRAMELINSKSQEIGNIIKAIDDIAFQTNILSLNAAVEAARAGVAGKGFAVVADEVRNLASKSAASARDTATLIDETLAAVAEGNKVADSTSDSISAIFEEASKLSMLVDGIAEAAEDQAISAEQIKTGVDQISSVVITNTSAAEQTAAVSEELLSQAHTLESVTSKFIFSN